MGDAYVTPADFENKGHLHTLRFSFPSLGHSYDGSIIRGADNEDENLSETEIIV